VILCTSERPDPYLNVIMHCRLALDTTDFVLVAVGDHVDPILSDKAARISDDISTLVANLSGGRYWWRNQKDSSVRTEQLEGPERFARVFDALGWGSLHISRLGLAEEELGQFLSDEAGKGSSFDVTGCKNSLVAGVSAALVSRGGSPIYTWEFRKTPTFGQADLLPALEPSQYVYIDLTSTPLLFAATRKVNAYSIGRRKFLVLSAGLAICFGMATLVASQTVVLLILTVLASFASILSAFSFFLRE
jgi:hypothetical protein